MIDPAQAPTPAQTDRRPTMLSPDQREILVPHDLTRGPLRSVRRMLIQNSVAELKELGVYDRYCACIAPAILTEVMDQVGPGWLPVELALEHYRACDALDLLDAAVERLGEIAGANVVRTMLVGAGLTPDSPGAPWVAIAAFARMGRRIYEGGSSQYVKLGPKSLQIENIGNPLLSIPYYRTAHRAFLRSAFGTLGVRVIETRMTPFRPKGQMVDVRLTWA